MSHPPSRLAARLRLLAAALLFSTGGAAIKAATLTGWQVASFRSGVAAIAVFPLVPAARARWTWRVVLVALVYAATMILFVSANKLTTSANAIFLQSTAPLWVLLAGPLLLGEPARRADAVTMLGVAVGMGLVFFGQDAPQTTAPEPVRGNLLAALSGVAWAGTVLGLRWVGREAVGEAVVRDAAGAPPASPAPASPAPASPALVTVVAGNVVACLVSLPMALPVTDVGLADAGVIVFLGVFQIGLAYLALATAMPHVPALEASTLLLVEPALNPGWAWLLHGERPGPLAWIGGLVIVGAAAAKTWWDARHAAWPRRGARRPSTATAPPDTMQP